MRSWRIPVLLVVAVAFLAAVFAGFILLLGTERGSAFAVRQVAAYFGDSVRIQGVHGSLAGSLRLSGISVRQDAMQGQMGALELHWRPAALLRGRVLIERVHLENGKLVLPAAAASDNTAADGGDGLPRLPEWLGWLDIEVRQLRLDDVVVARGDQPPLRVEAVALAARLREGELAVRDAVLRVDALAATGGASLGLFHPHPVRAHLVWEWSGLDDMLLGGATAVQGDTVRLLVTHRSQGEALPVDARLTLADPLEAARWDLDGSWRPFPLPLAAGAEALRLGAGAEALRLGAGVVSGSGDLHGYRLEVAASHEGGGLPPAAWRLVAAGDHEAMRIERLQGELLEGKVAAAGRVAWSPALHADLTVEGEALALQSLVPQLPPRLGFSAALEAHREGERLHIAGLELRLPEAGTALAVSGEVGLPPTAPPEASLELHWSDARWPLEGETVVVSKAGTVTLSGAPDDYRLAAEAALQGASIPPGQWRFAAAGDTRGLRIETLAGDWLDGHLMGSGEASWAPSLRWRFALAGEDIDPSSQWTEWPGRLAFAAATEGTLEAEGGAEARLALDRLTGQLRGYPVGAEGRALWRGEALQLEGVSLRSGGNRAELEGVAAADRLDLRWSLDAPDLAALMPDAGGRLRGSGTLAGSPQAPALDLRLEGADLHLGAHRLAGLDAAGRFAPEADDLSLEASLDRLTGEGTTLLEAATVRVGGSLARHTLEWRAQAPAGEVTGEFAGTLDRAGPRWSGELKDVVLEPAEARAVVPALAKAWRQEAPAALRLSGREAALAPFCLGPADASGRLCIDARWQQSGEAGASLRLEALPVALLHPDLSGELTGEASGGVAASGALEGSGRLRLSAGHMRVAVDGIPRRLPHRGGELAFALGGEGATAELSLAPLEGGSVVAEVHLPTWHAHRFDPEQPLRGELRAELPDLSPVQLFAPQLEQVTGMVRADFTVGGRLSRPILEGAAAIEQAGARVTPAGILVRDLTLRLTPEAGRPGVLRVSGGAASGRGSLSLAGVIDAAGGSAEVSVDGTRFQIVDTPLAQVEVSPRLALAWRDGTAHVRGDVLVPRASITPRLPNPLALGAAAETAPAVEGGHLVGRSPDVVVLGREEPSVEPPAPPARVDAAVMVTLGDAVVVDGVGFRGRLDGGVYLVIRPAESEPRGTGMIRVVEGSYRMLGQDLEVERGRILFDDAPLTQAELDLLAVRYITADNDHNVTAAGIEVHGPVTAPRMELVSVPQLDEAATIQSYLFTGRSPAAGLSPTLPLGMSLGSDVDVGYVIDPLEGNQSFYLHYEPLRRFGLELDVGERESGASLSFTHEN